MEAAELFRNDPFRDTDALMRRVYAYVAYRIGDGPDAEDVTSETFERAIRYRKSYDAARGAPFTWLLGIARRCIDDFARRRLELIDEPADEPTTARLEEDVPRHLELAAAIGSLSERERELIALRYGADLTARQIGELMGLRTNAVEVALHRALERLRVALGDTQDDNAAKAEGSAL